MPTKRRKRATATVSREQIVRMLAAHDRRLRKLESERGWVRETLAAIRQTVADTREQMTVMGQRFGVQESELRECRRASYGSRRAVTASEDGK